MEAIVAAELAEWREGLLSGDIAGTLQPQRGEDPQSLSPGRSNSSIQPTR